MVAEDEEAVASDLDNAVHESVEFQEENEQLESSSDNWESGEEDDARDQRTVAVVRETAADIPVSRLSVVSDSDRRRKHQSTKTPLRGQHKRFC